MLTTTKAQHHQHTRSNKRNTQYTLQTQSQLPKTRKQFPRRLVSDNITVEVWFWVQWFSSESEPVSKRWDDVILAPMSCKTQQATTDSASTASLHIHAGTADCAHALLNCRLKSGYPSRCRRQEHRPAACMHSETDSDEAE